MDSRLDWAGGPAKVDAMSLIVGVHRVSIELWLTFPNVTQADRHAGLDPGSLLRLCGDGSDPLALNHHDRQFPQ